MQRIKIFTASGAPTYQQLPINPVYADLSDKYKQEIVSTVDGDSIIHSSEFDANPITLTWKGINCDHTTFKRQMATLAKYLHKIIYVDFGTISYGVHVPTRSTQFKCRCADIETTIREGGKIRYENVTMTLLPMQT